MTANENRSNDSNSNSDIDSVGANDCATDSESEANHELHTRSLLGLQIDMQTYEDWVSCKIGWNLKVKQQQTWRHLNMSHQGDIHQHHTSCCSSSVCLF